jgi:hypothetical protein
MQSFPGNELPYEDDNRSRDSIILENEILMMKLTAEFGARIFLPEERVAPEIENHFLRSVYAFEKSTAEKTSTRSTIASRVGKVDWMKEEALTDEEVNTALSEILNHLYHHKIVLDTLAEYPDRVLYRFITTEFLDVAVDGIGDNDCYFHFCYEDFYPNHEYDLKQASRHFVEFVLDGVSIMPQGGLYTRVCTSSGLVIGYKEAMSVIRASAAEFFQPSLLQFTISDLTISEPLALVVFSVKYEACLQDGDKIIIEGDGRFEFILSDEIWWIARLSFPGIVI